MRLRAETFALEPNGHLVPLGLYEYDAEDPGQLEVILDEDPETLECWTETLYGGEYVVVVKTDGRTIYFVNPYR